MSAARVVIDKTCATCGGSGKETLPEDSFIGSQGKPIYLRTMVVDCMACHGRGTVVMAVSCSGCRWYQQAIVRKSGTCRNRTSFAHEHAVTREWGCASWEAKPE